MSTDFNEIWCQSMEIIGQSLLRELQFDQTIRCTIEDAEKANSGVYMVSNGSATFPAYSDNKYRKGDVVYVTIPEGDFNNTKLIVGKASSLADPDVYHYVSPLENFLEVQELNKISTTLSLLANDDRPNYQKKLIASQDNLNYHSLTRLGLSASFKAWLDDFDCRFGHYGLELILYGTEVKVTDETGKEVSSIPTTSLLLDSSNMIGNPYAFETFFVQEALFDISDFGKITKYELYFYQVPGTFKDSQGNPIRHDYDSINEENKELPDNLFVQDIYLSIGYDVRDTEGEFVKLTTFDSLDYKKDDTDFSRDIELTWMHEDAITGNKYPIDENTTTETFEIRWYYYKQNEKSDGYGGTNWKYAGQTGNEKLVLNNNRDFSASFIIDSTLPQEQIKVVILYGAAPEYKEYTNVSSDEFNNNVSQSYYIKEVINDKETGNYILAPSEHKSDITYYYLEVDTRSVYKSNILEFTGEQELDYGVVDDIIWGLNLHCYDQKGSLLVPSYGNYLLYNEQNELIDRAEANVVRQIDYQLVLDGVDYTNNIVEVEWQYPTTNTMIKPIIADNIILKAEAVKCDINEATFNKAKSKYYIIVTNYQKLTLASEEEYKNHLGNCWIKDADDKYQLCTTEDKFSSETIYYKASEVLTQCTDQDTFDATKFYYYYSNIYKYILNQSGASIPFQYYINQKYATNKDDNWIKCIVKYNDQLYTGVQELTFGTAGTQGANYSLLIDYVDDIAAVEVSTEEKTYALQLHIYDNTNKELSQENLSGIQVQWSWLNNITPTGFKWPSPNNMTCTITTTKEIQLNLSSAGIIQAAVTGLQNEGSNTSYTLYAYLPIAIRDIDYSHISGADKIVYLTDGTPEYYKDKYVLYGDDGNEVSSTWEIQIPTVKIENGEPGQKYYSYVGKIDEDTFKKEPHYQYNPKEDDTEDPYDIVSVYDKTLEYFVLREVTQSDLDYYYPTINQAKLQPHPFYVNNPNAPVCAAAGSVNQEVVYLQPILIIESRYFSSVINNWDGETIQMEEGTILASRIGAGRKNSENQFSGVIMGDWSKQSDADINSLNRYTGLYGFKNGQMTFGFKDDGTAFIGANGAGQILFDGNKSTITSANYVENTTGMFLDLDDGQLFLSKPGTTNYDNNKSYSGSLKLDMQGNYPIELISDVADGSAFKVGWDGTLYAKNGIFSGIITGGTLAASSGNIINLEGYLSVSGQQIKNDTTIRYEGKMGYSSTGGTDFTDPFKTDPNGIGFEYTSTIMNGQSSSSQQISMVKATGTNAGINYNKTNYVSCQESGVSLGTNKHIFLRGNIVVPSSYTTTSPPSVTGQEQPGQICFVILNN